MLYHCDSYLTNISLFKLYDLLFKVTSLDFIPQKKPEFFIAAVNLFFFFKLKNFWRFRFDSKSCNLYFLFIYFIFFYNQFRNRSKMFLKHEYIVVILILLLLFFCFVVVSFWVVKLNLLLYYICYAISFFFYSF